jgi:Tfp pilus assembly protein PilZ/ActR/RegA family two-component response regulator
MSVGDLSMHSGRPLVVVGFHDDAAGPIREAAASVGVTAAFVARCEDAPAVLDDILPLAVVLRQDTPGIAQSFNHVRSQPRLAQVPMFGVVADRSDLAFAELFAWGGDDLVCIDSPDTLVRRLRPLLAQAASARQAATGAVPGDRSADKHAIIAGAEAPWRIVMGRALYNGGFTIRFATSSEGLAEECAHEWVTVVVAADSLQPEGALAVLAKARELGSNAPWIVVTPPKQMAAAHAAVKTLGRASIADGFAPPENVLFLANELLAARGIDKRASPRMLYGTAVAFRAAGREKDEIGYSYNVSASGLYVRTTAPPDAGQEVWLEMWPPRAERRVRLSGKVAWKRPFGPVGGATVPAGFGVQLTDGLSGDLERWHAGNEAFAQILLGVTPVAA